MTSVANSGRSKFEGHCNFRIAYWQTQPAPWQRQYHPDTFDDFVFLTRQNYCNQRKIELQMRGRQPYNQVEHWNTIFTHFPQI